MSDHILEGGCQCGAVRYQVSGKPIMTALCHCTLCRRAHAAPAVAWAMYEEKNVIFTGNGLKQYHSSTEAKRGFCAHCGTQICFTATYIPGLIDIAIGSLDEPSLIEPTFHYWESERLSWLHISDELPRFPEFPPME